MTGFSGCNTLSGAYRLEGDSLAFGPLAMTRKACLRGEAGRIEAAFGRALGETAAWRITAGTLELRDRTGAIRARFLAGEER
ncbi:MAG: META domain-containing protein [Burkholderiales bacterium]|nr:META domain-containing protein [Burkholderiales bacterium]